MRNPEEVICYACLSKIASTCKGCNTCVKCQSAKEKNIPDLKLNHEKCQSIQPSKHRSFAKSRQSKMKIRYTYGSHHRLDHTYAAAVNFNDVLQVKPVERQPLKQLNEEPNNQLLKKSNPLCLREETSISEEKSKSEEPFLNKIHGIGFKINQEMVIESAKNENDDINLKSSWLRNLCLEYQPARNISKSQLQNDLVSNKNEVLKDKNSRFHLTGTTNTTLKQYQRNRKINKIKSDHSSTFFGKNKNIKSIQEDKKRWIAALALVELAHSK